MIPCPRCSKLSPNDAKRCASCGYSFVATTRIAKAEINPFQSTSTQSPDAIGEEAGKPPLFNPFTLARVLGVGSAIVGVLIAWIARYSVNIYSVLLVGALILGGLGMLIHAKWGLMTVRVGSIFGLLSIGSLIFLMLTMPRSPPEGLVAGLVLMGGFECFALYHLMLNRPLKELYE